MKIDNTVQAERAIDPSVKRSSDYSSGVPVFTITIIMPLSRLLIFGFDRNIIIQ